MVTVGVHWVQDYSVGRVTDDQGRRAFALGVQLPGGYSEVRVLRDLSMTLNGINGFVKEGTVVGIYNAEPHSIHAIWKFDPINKKDLPPEAEFALELFDDDMVIDNAFRAPRYRAPTPPSMPLHYCRRLAHTSAWRRTKPLPLSPALSPIASILGAQRKCGGQPRVAALDGTGKRGEDSASH
uniref:Uncharacterized protein n=1 Tax=Oryza glumipatula TaxID=40148 RepID=A0A0E0BPV7_9ORYZ